LLIPKESWRNSFAITIEENGRQGGRSFVLIADKAMCPLRAVHSWAHVADALSSAVVALQGQPLKIAGASLSLAATLVNIADEVSFPAAFPKNCVARPPLPACCSARSLSCAALGQAAFQYITGLWTSEPSIVLAQFLGARAREVSAFAETQNAAIRLSGPATE
jgi:hypothetical protein